MRDLGPVPKTQEELQRWLTAAWARNVATAEVAAALRGAAWQRSDKDFNAIDLDGKGRQEWLLTLYVSTPGPEPPFGPPGLYWLVGDGGVFYRFGAAEEFTSAPSLIASGDMTGDRLPEAVIEDMGCGAHTCTHFYYVLGLRFGTIGSIVRPPQQPGAPDSIAMPTATAQVRDATGDGLLDLVLTGGTINSLGAGIQRGSTEVWSWDSRAMTVVLKEATWQPSTWRFHVLYNANEAFEEGDYRTARSLYQRVINDATLKDTDEFPASGPTYPSSRQFAAFRLVLLALLVERDLGPASEWDRWLTRNYPETALEQASLVLVREWSFTHDLARACRDVTAELLTYPNPTGTLEYLGYANPELKAEDVCPIR